MMEEWNVFFINQYIYMLLNLLLWEKVRKKKAVSSFGAHLIFTSIGEGGGGDVGVLLDW